MNSPKIPARGNALNADEIQLFLAGYHKDPAPALVPKVFAYFDREQSLSKQATRGPAAGVILALYERHPEYAADWDKAFPDLRDKARRALQKVQSQDRPGYNDALLTRWFILHDVAALRKVRDRADRKDAVGVSAMWALESLLGGDEAMRIEIVKYAQERQVKA